MENTKIVKALKSLDSSELKRFREFVYSPYFNKHERLKQLIDLFAEAAPDYSNGSLSKEKLFKKLFPGEKYKQQRLSDLLTYLYRLFEKFIAQQGMETDPVKKPHLLLKSYRQKGLDKNFLSIVQSVKSDENITKKLSEEAFLNAYQLETESDLYFTSKDSRTSDRSIERKTLNLDLFYLTSKLRNSCEMINRQNIINARFEIKMLDEVKEYVNLHYSDFHEHPAILIYYQILLTLQDEKIESNYQKLIALLEQNAKDLPQDEVRTMYDYAQNYCIKKINSGKSAYLKEVFNLYKQLLDKGIIPAEGNLSPWDYKNIVTVGSRLKEFSWTENFVQKYKECLPADERENAFAYNLASLYYAEKKYDKALRLLQAVEFTDVYYSLGARSLLLKVYYESDEFEPLFSLFDSFKIYLKRNKLVSQYQYAVHMNLIKMVKRLAVIKIKMASARKETVRKELEKVKKRIEASQEITNLNWLLEMVQEIETETK